MNDVTPHQWYRAIWSNGKARFGICVTAFFLSRTRGPLLVGDPIAFIGIPINPRLQHTGLVLQDKVKMCSLKSSLALASP